MEKEILYKQLSDAVVGMDEDLAVHAAGEALRLGLDPYEAITLGLAGGMNRANALFEQEEYYVPELLLCADAMYAGIEVLKAHIPKNCHTGKRKAVIGVVKGDTHDIGKNLVKIMLESGGFEIHDLGRDVPLARFVDAAGEAGADLVCLSTLMTTTMDGMGVVIQDLKKAGIPARTMVGGGPISPAFARSIGADGWARNAAEAVKVARSLVEGSGLLPSWPEVMP